jgi:glycosyltransferase involved in cell wall biosynthesis
MNNPLVSIIVPCYNQAQYLDETLLSVLEQTYTQWECIIVDDGSSDNTALIAEKWKYKDNRFIYLYKENGGLSSARNLGLGVAKGAYIQFLDSDDCIEKTKLELSLQQLNEAKGREVKVAISNFRMFVDNPSKTRAPYCKLHSELFHFDSLLYNWEELFTIPIHCGLFNSSLFFSFRFPEHLKAREDWVMWVSFFHTECKVVFIDQPLALYRKSSESMTMTADMLPDLLSAYCFFKNLLSEEESNKLSIVLISRYYRSSMYFKVKLASICESNTYRSGNFIKKLFRKIGILNISKQGFQKILQLSGIAKYF